MLKSIYRCSCKGVVAGREVIFLFSLCATFALSSSWLPPHIDNVNFNRDHPVNSSLVISRRLQSSESQDHCTQHGCLPLYYIIGSPKSGTTSLWEMFRIESLKSGQANYDTPCVASRKELRFWNKESDVSSEKKTNRYRSFFPLNHECNTGAYLEATPTYLGTVP